MCLAEGHNAVMPVSLELETENPRPFALELSTLPLSHCVPVDVRCRWIRLYNSFGKLE